MRVVRGGGAVEAPYQFVLAATLQHVVLREG
jgi:hypothetical protein